MPRNCLRWTMSLIFFLWGGNALWAQKEPDRATDTDVAVWISEGHGASADSDITIPLIVGEVEQQHHVNSFELELNYDDSLLTYTGLELANSLIEGWDLVVDNEPSAGRILVSAADTSLVEITAGQDTVLLSFNFQVKEGATVGNCSDLILPPAEFVFNAGTPTATVLDGVFCVTPTPPPTADLSLNQTLNPPVLNLGETATLNFTVTNAGPDSASGISVSAPLAAGLSYVSDNGGGSYSGGIWTVGTLASGSSASLQITATFDGPGNVTNSAEIAASDMGDPDSTPGNGNVEEDDYAEVVVRAPLADLSLANRVSNVIPFVGDVFVFTLTLTNSGPDAATNIEVMAPLPSGVSPVGLREIRGSGVYSKGVWSLATLEANGSAVLEIMATADSPGLKSFSAEITASDANDPDSTPGNGVSSEDDQDASSITARSVEGAVFVINNVDLPGEGLNDPTPVDPIGGNPGSTLGEQRLHAVERAAAIWAANLISDVDIVIDVQFTSCVSGSLPAEFFPQTANRNFPNAPLADVWYPSALANTLAGSDLNGADPEIEAQISADLSCSGNSWYLGLDGLPQTGQVDMVTVLVKEMALGLGFVSLTDKDTGGLLFGNIDVFSTFLEDHGMGKTWAEMSSSERLASASGGALVWGGSAVNDVAPEVLNEGVHSSGRVEMQGDPAQSLFIFEIPGQPRDLPLLRWNDSLNPAQSQQVGYNGPNHDPGLAVYGLFDIGWSQLGQSDLRLSMTVDNQLAVPGEEVTFTLTLSNDGPEPATGVEVTDLLPGGLTYVSHSGGAYVSSNGVWLVGTLDENTNVSLNITALVGDGGVKRNVAEVTASDQGDPDSSPNNGLSLEDDLASVTVGNADVSISLSADDTSPGLGDLVTLEIAVSNSGPDLATGVVVKDLLAGASPPPLEYVSDNSGGDYSPETGSWVVGNLLVGETRALLITAQMNTNGAVSNTAEVIAADVTDPDSTPNNHSVGEDDLASISLAAPIADLSLSSSMDNDRPFSGEQVVLSLTIDNAGPDSASNIESHIMIPSGMSYVSHSGGNYNNGVWIVAALDSGLSSSMDLVLAVNSSGAHAVTAEIASASEFDPDSVHGNGVAGEDDWTQANLATPVADLSLTKTAVNATANVGDTVTFVIDVHNSGPDPATGVVVADLLPAGLAYQSDTGGGAYQSGTGLWDVGALAVGATVSLSIQAEVTVPGTKVNVAQVAAADQDDPDSTPGSGSDEDDDDSATVGKADMSMTMTVDDPVPFVGDGPTFTITLSNAGPDHATSVFVKAQLPEGLAFTSSGGSYNNGIWEVGQLNSGTQVSLTVTAEVASIGPKTFVAEVLSTDHADPDSTPNNAVASEDDQAQVTVTPQSSASATIVIVNGDNPGEGFNDSKPVAPVGGNSGTTLGEQRLIAFQYAADIWGGLINSDVTIRVLSKFDGLSCSAFSGILGSAGPQTVARDFPGAQFPNTWYHAALANALSGTDQNGGNQEIRATFNSSIDNNNSCLNGTNWYYGLDGNAGNDIDLVTVLLHEMGHGLGFSTFVNGSSGQQFYGRPDVYMRNLEDHSRGKRWDQMSDAERRTSAIDTNDLHWVGQNVVNQSGILSAGANSQGHVEMYAPNPFQGGSSVSHFSTRLSPNELMEPFNTGVIHDPRLAVPLLNDLGWTSQPLSDLRLEATVSNLAPNPEEMIDITLTVFNDGPGRTTGVEVTGLLPDGLTFFSASRGSGYDESTGVWDVGALDPGDSPSLTLSVRVDSLNDITFSAEVTKSNREDPDSIPANGDPGEDDYDEAVIDPQFIGEADLSLALTASDTTPDVGDVITLSYTLSNAGPDDATQSVVRVNGVSGLNFGVATGQGSFNASTGQWSPGLIGSGGSAVLQIPATVLNDAAKTLESEVIASAETDPDSTPDNGSGEDDYASLLIEPMPVGVADLSVLLSVDDAAPDPGTSVVITLEVFNDGPDVAENVVVAQTLSSGLAYQSHNGGSFSVGSGRWSLGSVPSGGSVSVSLTAQVNNTNAQESRAEVAGVIQSDPDSTPDNGAASEDDYSAVSIQPRYADLSLSKTVDLPNVEVGESVVFTLNVANSGPDEAMVEARDQLPSGFTYVTHGGDGSYNSATGDWSIGALASGASAILQIEATVDAPGLSLNHAQIMSSNRFDPDSTPGNGASNEDDQDSAGVMSRSANGANIVIVNADGPGEGFNDPTPVAPVGGNDGTTLGAQRLNAFQHAANIWGSLLNSDVDIEVNAKFDPLTCSAGSAVLGSAGPSTVARDFPGSEFSGTWYHVALANALAGVAQNGSGSEINATFNSSLDNNGNCLAGTNWYYGLDGNPAGSNIDLVSVLLHEFAHGLGFSTFVNGTTGSPFYGYDDIYMRNLKDASRGRNWDQMTNPERATSAVDTGDLVWTGPIVTGNSGLLNSGVHGSGEVEMFAPNPYQGGSSVSHFSTSLSPNELMEPYYTGPNHEPGLSVGLMLDIGWTGQKQADLSLSNRVDNPGALPSEQVVFTVTVTNDGPEDAGEVEVQNLLPGGFTWLGDTGDYDSGTGLWTIGDLANGDSAILQITASVNGSGSKTSVAEIVNSDRMDPDSVPDNGSPEEDDRDIASVGNSDLSLTVAVDNAEPPINSTVVFHVHLENAGPDPATGVVVNASLPLGFDFVSASGAAYNNATGQWQVGELGSGDSVDLFLNAVVRNTDASVFTAQVTASDLADADSTPGNNAPSEDDQDSVAIAPLVTALADLRLSLSVGNGSPILGDNTTLTCAVTNDGPDATDNVTVSLPLPAGLVLVDQVGDGSYSDGTGLWTIGDLNSGEAVSISLIIQATGLGNKIVEGEVETSDVFDPDSIPGNGVTGEDDQSALTIVPQIEQNGTIRILNADGPGEGFNDQTPVSPVGGNTGTTLGQQRLIAFQYAADIWSQHIQTNVQIVIQAQFNPLTCSASSAVLGSAGPLQVSRDFSGAEFSSTWYHMALANALAGTDLNGSGAEIGATFNSSVDNNSNCLSGTNWYYGLDGQATGIDLVAVLLHEFAHGLGVSSFVNGQTGAKFNGLDDIYMRHLKDEDTGKAWPDMTDAERRTSALNTGDLVWDGAEVKANSGGLTSGVSPGGETEMYAPNPYQPGSSVSHFSTSLSPNDLMEPFYTGPNHEVGLSEYLLIDEGWGERTKADLSLSVSVSDATPDFGDSITLEVSLLNSGPGDATGITINALLPAGLTFVSDSGNYDEGTGVWNVGALASGSSDMLTITATVNSGSAMTFMAQAATASPADPDSSPGNGDPSEDDQDSLSITPTGTGTADLSLSMAVDNDTPDVGDHVVFTITIDNDGPDTATGLLVLDDLPAGLDFVSSNGAYDANTGVWTVDPIAAGGFDSLSITCIVNSADAIVNRAEVIAVNQEDPDSTPNNGVSSEDDMDQVSLAPVFTPLADLSLSILVDSASPKVGAVAVFTIRVENNGPQTASGIMVSESRTSGLELVNTTGPGSYSGGVWNVGSLSPGAHATLTLETLVASLGAKTLEAEIEAASPDDPDSTPANGEPLEDDQDSVTVTPRAGGAGGAVIVILNDDGPGEGFNDPTPVDPLGGNGGTTLGEQRLNAFQYAADIWGSLISSPVTIVVRSRFDTLTCSPSSGVLGAAGPYSVVRDFPGNIFPDTWHHMALANAMAGSDLNGTDPEITATFNSAIDNNSGCLSGTNWYYGLDGNPGGNIDLVSVLLHEMGHGLGFSTFVNSNSGQKFQGRDDVYMRFLENHATNKMWPDMTDSQRAASAVGSGNLHWRGPELIAASGILGSGVNGAGHVEMFAPNPVRPGSSVSHFSTSLGPDELMEPYYTGPNHDPSLAIDLFRDIGWPTGDMADLELSVSVDNPTPNPGDSVTFTLSLYNDGPDPATGVQASALLGDGLIYVSHSGDGTLADDGWHVGVLPVGDTAVLDIVVTVGDGGDKTLFSEVTASDIPDPDSTPNNGNGSEDDQDSETVGSADLSLDKSVDVQTPTILTGSLATYTLRLDNAGPDTATDVVVNDLLPDEVSYVSSTNGQNYNPATGDWTVPAIGAGASETLQITVRVDEAGTITNTAEVVSSEQGDPDSTPGNGVGSEDDQAEADMVGEAPVSNDLELLVSGFFSVSCPDIAVRLQVLLNGNPVNNLSESAFTLFEDGSPLAFTLVGVSVNGEYELTYATPKPDGQSHVIDLSVASSGETANLTTSTINCHISGVTEIFNNQIVSGLAGTSGSWLYYKIAVPGGQGSLDFTGFGGTGDGDLYIKYGGLPELNDYDYRPFIPGNDETVHVDHPLGGDWYIGIRAVQSFSNMGLRVNYAGVTATLEILDIFTNDCPDIVVKTRVSLDGDGVIGMGQSDFGLREDNVTQGFAVTAGTTDGEYLLTFETPDPDGSSHNVEVFANVLGSTVSDTKAYANCSSGGVTEIFNNQLVSPLAGARGSWLYFKINVPAGQDALAIDIFSGSGDADLYVRHGAPPDINSFDARPYVGGNVEHVEITNPTGGDWYIGLHGYFNYSGVSLIASYYVETISVEVTSLSIAACPDITVTVQVEDQFGAVSGLSMGDFQITEDNNAAVNPHTLSETTAGTYQLTYHTPNNDGSDVIASLNVNGALETWSYRNCSRDGGVLDVWVNGQHGAPVGDEIVIPVWIQPVEFNQQVTSFQFDLSYGTDVLSFSGLELAGTLVQSWNFVAAEEATGGLVTVNAADVSQLVLSSTEDQMLIGLRFFVTGFEGSCTDLNLPQSKFLFNDGTPLSRTGNGGFCVSEGGCPRTVGDINGDGNDAQAFDALQVLNLVSGIATPFDPIPLCVADTNCSGDISIMDAVQILWKDVEIIDQYCEPGRSVSGGVFDIQLPETDFPVGEAFTLTLNLSQLPGDPVYGYSFDMTYDPAYLTFSGEVDRSNTLTARWGDPIVVSDVGRLTVTGVYPLESLSGEGSLIKLQGVASNINTGATALNFTRFELASEGEPVQAFGPLTVTVSGDACFDVSTYFGLIENWNQGGVSVLDLVDIINCD